MSKNFFLNDPIYGLVIIPNSLLLNLIDYPIFQRLRRISQTGMAHYVYPGSVHTRFQHAIGAMHLMTRVLHTLESKGVRVSSEEKTGLCAAILLHDIGHCPYSHSLENVLVHVDHEKLSLLQLQKLNIEFDGKLDLGIQIFRNMYPKKYLSELVSGQLDIDRMDYLNRDSFYTGVAEGVVSYNRLIQMFNVIDGRLVVEEKGIYSVENFLLARRFMYWQVYHHKTSLATDQMLKLIVKRAKQIIIDNGHVDCSTHLTTLLKLRPSDTITDNILHTFSQVDDIDIMDLVKRNLYSSDKILSYICQSLIKRQLFKVSLSHNVIKQELIDSKIVEIEKKLNLKYKEAKFLVSSGEISSQVYNLDNEINIHMKNGDVRPLSSISSLELNNKTYRKYFLCFPNF